MRLHRIGCPEGVIASLHASSYDFSRFTPAFKSKVVFVATWHTKMLVIDFQVMLHCTQLHHLINAIALHMTLVEAAKLAQCQHYMLLWLWWYNISCFS